MQLMAVAMESAVSGASSFRFVVLGRVWIKRSMQQRFFQVAVLAQKTEKGAEGQ